MQQGVLDKARSGTERSSSLNSNRLRIYNFHHINRTKQEWGKSHAQLSAPYTYHHQTPHAVVGRNRRLLLQWVTVIASNLQCTTVSAQLYFCLAQVGREKLCFLQFYRHLQRHRKPIPKNNSKMSPSILCVPSDLPTNLCTLCWLLTIVKYSVSI